MCILEIQLHAGAAYVRSDLIRHLQIVTARLILMGEDWFRMGYSCLKGGEQTSDTFAIKAD
jgi:hypothetical protein